MGFFDFDRDVEPGIDEMFDFNGDGRLDCGEEAMEFRAMENMSEGRDPWDDGGDSDSSDDEDELEMSGLDRFDLEMMDDDERREALEDAGLDPDDYDF